MCVQLVKVTKIIMGKSTPVFLKQDANGVPDKLCFSLVLPDRTLDLAADTVARRENWVEALKVAITKVQQQRKAWNESVEARKASVMPRSG